jgi:hypothetical protein
MEMNFWERAWLEREVKKDPSRSRIYIPPTVKLLNKYTPYRPPLTLLSAIKPRLSARMRGSAASPRFYEDIR